MDAKTSMHEPIVVLEFGGIIGFKGKTTHVRKKKNLQYSTQKFTKLV
jgi:hypothetical protein